MLAFLLVLRAVLFVGVFGWFCHGWAVSYGMPPWRWLLIGLVLGPFSIPLLLMATPWPTDPDESDDGGFPSLNEPRPPERGPSHGRPAVPLRRHAQHRVSMSRRRKS